MAELKRIDCHVHYLPSDFGAGSNAAVSQRAAEQGAFMSAVLKRPAWRDLAVLSRVLDSTGVDLGFIIPNHVSLADYRGRPAHVANEAYNRSMSADLEQSGNSRFVAMAVVDPFGGPEDVAQLDRSLQLPHIGGIGLVTNYGDVTLDDPRFEPIFAVARDHDVPITVHPGGAWPSWEGPLRLRESSFLLSNLGFFLTDAMCIFLMAHGGVFDRFPTVRFMFCQLGGLAPICCGRWAAAIKHARIGLGEGAELPAWASHSLNDVLSRLWLDSHSQNRHALSMALAEAGSHTVVLGGDYPVTLPELGVDYAMAELNALGLPAETLRRIERDNALALLGKQAERLLTS